MALSDRQLANLWSKLEQNGIKLRAAEQNLQRAQEAGATNAETRTIRAEITRIQKDSKAINARLTADAKEIADEDGEDTPPTPPLKTPTAQINVRTTGGTGMGLAEDREALMQANVALGEALAAAVVAATHLEAAEQAAASAIQNYDQQDLVAATGQIAQATQDQFAVSQAIAQAQQNIDSFVQRMS